MEATLRSQIDAVSAATKDLLSLNLHLLTTGTFYAIQAMLL